MSYTTPQPGPAIPPPPPHATDSFFNSIRRFNIQRSEKRWVGGVAGGVAERYGWDPTLVRGILFVSFFLSGLGLVAYALGWALLPERRDGRIHLQEAIRGNFDVALVGSGAALLVGLGWLNGLTTWWWGRTGFGWIIGLVWFGFWITAIVLFVRWIQARHREKAWTQGGSTPPVGGAPFSPAAEAATPPAPTTPTTPPFPSPAGPAPSSVPVNPVHQTAEVQAAAAKAEAKRQKAAAKAQAAEVKSRYAEARAKERAMKPIVKGPGGAAVGAVIGLLAIAAAIVLGIDRIGPGFAWWVIPGLLWFGGALIILGIAIAIAGMRGRSSGWLGFFAIIALVIAVPWTMGSGPTTTVVYGPDGTQQRVVDGRFHWRGWSGTRGGVTIGDGTTRVTTIDAAQRGFRVQFGNPTVDLSELDLTDVTPGDPVQIPVSITAGDLTIIVPRNVEVDAQVRLLAGAVQWQVGGQDIEAARVGGSTAFFTTTANNEDNALILLDINAGAGQVTVKEARR